MAKTPKHKTKNARVKRLRAKLFALQGGLCFWCECPMRDDDYESKRGKTPPLNQATLDHLDDRFSPERGKHPGVHYRKVVSCWECNNRRGKESQAAQPIEELWRRASRHPERLTAPQ